MADPGDLQRRRLGRTELQVSVLGLGAMGVIGHVHPTRASAVRVVHRALDLGVDFIDTAASYFDSEAVLGEALRGRRDGVVLATKSYMRGKRRFIAELEQSFRRMRTDYIDIYQLHHVQYDRELRQLLAPGGAYEILDRAREQGRIRYIGITSHHPGVLVQALRTGLFDTVQFPFNAIEGEQFREVFAAAGELDVGTLAMKALSGGRLTSVESALRYCAASGIDCTLAGCTTVEHVERDVAALRGEWEVSAELREQMEQEIATLGDLFCRRCRYCEQRCKRGIPISDVFRCHDYLVLNQDYARTEYAKLGRPAAQCEECGACEGICPYDLPVREMLKTADTDLRRHRARDMAIKLLHLTRTYDVTRRLYFRIRGAGGLPEHRYLHRKDIGRDDR